jgi:protein TonB
MGIFKFGLIAILIIQSCKTKGQGNCENKIDLISGKNIVERVDSLPVYPGGIPALNKFIAQNFNDNKNEPFQGTFNLVFIINSNGIIIHSRIDNKMPKNYTSAEKEMLRVISLTHKWIPGKCGSKNVTCLIKHPFHF